MTAPRHSARRWLVVALLTLMLLVGGAVAFLRVRFTGTALAGTIGDFLNEEMSGRIRVGSIDWPADGLTKVVTGGWVPFTMTDVQVWDNEGTELVYVRRITCELDVHALLFGNHDFVFRHVVLDTGRVLLEEIREPVKLHAYDYTVFSILAAFYGKRPPGFEVGVSASQPPVFDIRDFELKNIDFTLKLALEGRTSEETQTKEERSHMAEATLTSVNGKGFFYTDPRDPIVPKLYFSVGSEQAPLTAEHAQFKLLDFPLPLEFDHFAVTQFAQLPEEWPRSSVANSLRFKLRADHEADDGVLAIEGAMEDYWSTAYGGTYDIDITITDAGGIAARLDPWMGGEDATIAAKVKGPILFPTLEANVSGLEYRVPLQEGEPPLVLTLAPKPVDPPGIPLPMVTLDLATEEGTLLTIAKAREDGAPDAQLGEVEINAKFGIGPYYANATVTISKDKPIELRKWLPAGASSIVGSKIHGTFHARGDASATVEACMKDQDEQKQDCGLLVDDLDLHLGAVHLHGGTILASLDVNMDSVRLNDIQGQAGDTSFTIDGVLKPEAETFDVDLFVDSRDLDSWLRRAGVTAFAQTARGKISAGGRLDDPHAHGDLDLDGVEVIDDLALAFRYGDQVIEIERGSSRGIGKIEVDGKIRLDRVARAEHIHVRGREVELGKIPGAAGVASGKATLDVKVHGPIGPKLGIDAWLAADEVVVLGQRATNLRACYNHDPTDTVCQQALVLDDAEAARCTEDARRGGMCVVAGLTRASGGTATVWARTDARGKLAGHADIDELPLSAIAELAGTGKLPAGGTARLDVDLSGTLSAPTADGELDVFRTWLLNAYLGDQGFVLRAAATEDPGVECGMGAAGPPAPATGPTGKLALCGTLSDGRVVVGAVIATSGKFETHARVDVRRIELDPFVDLAALIGSSTPVRAWATGTITAETELLGDQPPDVQLELSELALLVERSDGDGRPAPLVVSAATPLSLHYDGKTATLGRPLTLATPAGELTLDGFATRDELSLAVSGSLDVKELEPLLATWLDKAEGTIDVAGTVKGDLTNPSINATLALRNVALRPTRQDAELTIAKATFELTPQKLEFAPFEISVYDQSSEEKAVLLAEGDIELDRLTPTQWNIKLDGDLAGKMLLALAPAELSQASGVAHVNVTLAGTGETPQVSGALTFDPSRPFSVMPRGLRRDIILSDGRIVFSEDVISLEDVSGSIDDEGRISNVNGQIDLVDGSPTGGDITLTADGIPFRVPRTLDLVISAEELRLIWGDDDDGDGLPDMSITGGVEVVQGRFVKDFSFNELVLQPSDSGGGASVPFWETYPMLGRAHLDLTIHAGSLSVVNNIANIELAGEVRLTGTPRLPELEGEIQVQRGTFKPQFTRARFTRTRGSVTFSHFSRFPDETPVLDISSEADYRDSTGQDHLISLSLQGPLSRLSWDLSTSSGLNKSQTISLIVSGKAPADVLRNANDPLGADPNLIDPSTNPTDGAADQLLKDVAGDFISLLVADPLKDIEILDVARVEVGTGSIGFHGERKVATNANVVGDVEQTVRGRTINLRMEVKWTNGLTLQLGWLSKDFDDPAEEDVTDREAKVVYRWFLP